MRNLFLILMFPAFWAQAATNDGARRITSIYLSQPKKVTVAIYYTFIRNP